MGLTPRAQTDAHPECLALGTVGHDYGVCRCTGYDPTSRVAARELWRRLRDPEWRRRNTLRSDDGDGTPTPVTACDETFTIVMSSVLRGRFERWLRRNHLQMTTRADSNIYTVAAPQGVSE
jgi:hypothetical protein